MCNKYLYLKPPENHNKEETKEKKVKDKNNSVPNSSTKTNEDKKLKNSCCKLI